MLSPAMRISVKSWVSRHRLRTSLWVVESVGRCAPVDILHTSVSSTRAAQLGSRRFFSLLCRLDPLHLTFYHSEKLSWKITSLVASATPAFCLSATLKSRGFCRISHGLVRVHVRLLVCVLCVVLLLSSRPHCVRSITNVWTWWRRTTTTTSTCPIELRDTAGLSLPFYLSSWPSQCPIRWHDASVWRLLPSCESSQPCHAWLQKSLHPRK